MQFHSKNHTAVLIKEDYLSTVCKDYPGVELVITRSRYDDYWTYRMRSTTLSPKEKLMAVVMGVQSVVEMDAEIDCVEILEMIWNEKVFLSGPEGGNIDYSCYDTTNVTFEANVMDENLWQDTEEEPQDDESETFVEEIPEDDESDSVVNDNITDNS